MAYNANMGLNFDAVPSIEDTSSSLGDYLGAVASDAWGYNPTVATKRGLDILHSTIDMGDVDVGNDDIDIDAGSFDSTGAWQNGDVGGIQRKAESALPIEEQQKMIDAAGLTGKLKPQDGYNAETLRLLFNNKHQEAENALIREQASNWMAPIGFLGTLGVSLLDPINVASGFMPVVSQARQLRMLQGASGFWGRTGARALVGVAEGAAGAAAVEPVLQLARSIEQADWHMYESLINISFGSVMGAVLHTGKGALGEWIRNRRGQRHEWEIAAPTDESEVLRRQMAQDVLQAAKDAGAEKIGSMEAEAAAILFDVHARQWAYDFRESGGTIAGFYEKYAPVWKAGTLNAMRDEGNNLGTVLGTFIGGLTEEGLARGRSAARIVDALREAEFRESAGMDMEGIASETGWRKINGKWQYEGEPVSLNQFLGEKGAAELDAAENATRRKEALSVAQKMESAGKDAKAIKMATGWERGADGKWRFEIDDSFLDAARLEQLRENRKKFNFNSKEKQPLFYANLEDLINDPAVRKALKEAYGQLPTVYIGHEGWGGGEYDGFKNAIYLHTASGKDVLLHEIQHFIQHKEGFERGGDLRLADNIIDTAPEIIKKREKIKLLEKEAQGKGGEPLRLAKEFRKAEKKLGLQDSSKRMTPEQQDAYRQRVKELQEENPDAVENLKDILRRKEEAMATAERRAKELEESIPVNVEIYRRMSGEVEARNVQSRMNMSMEERLETLSRETEDVARENQILLNESSEFQDRIDALENIEGLSPADRGALTADLNRARQAARHREIENTVREIGDGSRPGGPEPGDVVSGPAVLHQWQNVPEWKQRLADWMRNDGYSEKEIAEHIGAIEGQMKLYEALGDKLAAEVQGAKVAEKSSNQGVKFSGPVRSNADEIYVISFDCSSQCVKRLAAANTAKIAEEALGRPLKVEEQMALIALERAKGQEAPCVYCYVESNRAKARQAVGRAFDLIEKGEIPKTWGKQRKEAAAAAIKLFRESGLKREDINYEYVLNQSIRNTPEIASIREDPRFRDIYAYFDFEANATKQNIAKPYEEYTGEMLDLTPEQVEMLNGYAGMRFFSTSDFQVEHVVDLIQAFWDMNAMGLKTHGYTKVPMYVDIFGDTGQKINMSCFAKVDPETGEIRMDEAQGWNWDKAREYRAKHPDVGIIFVCANDKILNWAMNQEWIDYCIPFHYSGLEKQYYLQMGWQDFTSTQMESNIYATNRTRASGVFEERPVKTVNAGEQKMLDALPPEQAAVEYARLCYERRLFPVKPEEFFKPELIGGGNKAQRASSAKALWLDVLESEDFDPDMINPSYWEKYKTKGATTKEKTVDDVSVKRVRMHEMGTQDGISDADGTKRYLELCMERKIYPVFINFLFKNYKEAELSPANMANLEKSYAAWVAKNERKVRAEIEKTDLAVWKTAHPKATPEMQAKFLESKVADTLKFKRLDMEAAMLGKKRGAHVKTAKERWEDMVIAGKVDWEAINPNFFKLKKDYARTDTPFRVPDPRKINAMAANRPLEETLAKGLAEKYHGDPEIAGQLTRLSRYGEENGINIGSASLNALRRGEHPMAVAGEAVELDRSQLNSLWQKKRKPSKNYADKQRAEAEAARAQRQPVEPTEPVEEAGATSEDAGASPLGEEQGRITFGALEDGRALIEIFKAADATSPPHELYHLFRRQMAESASDPNAPQRVKDMYRQACEFVGAEPGKPWTVEQEEKFARAGERFLHEGKAPNANLQGMFDRMKEWFTEVYGAAEEHGFEISDDMRKLFGDMMLSPSVEEAEAAFRYSLGRLLEYDPAEGADVNPAMRTDGAVTPDAIAEMQEVATTRVERSLDSLSERMPEREIEAFRAEFDEAMRLEDEAAAAVARHGEILEDALACEMRSV